jgi:hypothetical protein
MDMAVDITEVEQGARARVMALIDTIITVDMGTAAIPLMEETEAVLEDIPGRLDHLSIRLQLELPVTTMHRVAVITIVMVVVAAGAMETVTVAMVTPQVHGQPNIQVKTHMVAVEEVEQAVVGGICDRVEAYCTMICCILCKTTYGWRGFGRFGFDTQSSTIDWAHYLLSFYSLRIRRDCFSTGTVQGHFT